MSNPRDNQLKHLSFADLIDIERQFHLDEQQPIEITKIRDREIAQKIKSEEIEPPELYRRWLGEIRDEQSASPGRSLDAAFEVMHLLAILGGLLVGGSVVGAWLSIESGKPVNSVHFWGTLVGVQLAILVLSLLALVVRSTISRLPGVAGVITLGKPVMQLLLRMLGWLALSNRKEVATGLLIARRYDSILRPLLVWRLASIPQMFGVMFNLGAVGMLIFLSIFSDPAFGWRSTLLEENQVAKMTHIVALPWSGVIPDAYPDLQQVQSTRYSSLDDLFLDNAQWQAREDATRWTAWWAFLLASLCVYGFLPRLVLVVVTSGRYRYLLHHVKLNDAHYRNLYQRLQPIRSTAPLADRSHPPHSAIAAHEHQPHSQFSQSYIVLHWEGVDLDENTLRNSLAKRNIHTIAGIYPVGHLNVADDRQALESVRRSAAETGICLIVQAWEPPKADYMDFIDSLREAVGRDRTIEILLYHQDSNHLPVAPRQSDARIWEHQINKRADRYLNVASLVEEHS